MSWSSACDLPATWPAEVPQLFVLLVVIERQNWDAVVNVHAEAKGAVVDNHHVLQAPVGNDAQIFDQPILALNTVLAIEPI